jgi:tRNA threonylcarbamoyladenosine biosynthesis protein TsaE
VSVNYELQRFAENESGTQDLALAVADALPQQLLIGLIGTLGAGKTRFVKGLAEGLDVPPANVTSPTFVLCQSHQGRCLLHHVDAYRVADDDEWYELGIDERIEDEAITVIEWSDRFAHLLPTERLDIQVEILGETARMFHFRATGKEAVATLRRL